MRLGTDERPYEAVTESREGSYWNLVAPYALASGLFPPGGSQARGALAYLLRHGSRLLGLVRAGGYALYGPGASPELSGTDQVYGVNAARFMAAEDQADQLVLSLYGQLAAGMTPKTFVAGEAASVAPLDGLRYRAAYLPPNAVANDSFLETLRLMLVRDSPDGLRLAFATPRGWLGSGKRIAVTAVPTRFGPVSYSLAASARAVLVHLEPPAERPRRLLLRLRLPAGVRIRSVSPRRPFDGATGTIDLSGTDRCASTWSFGPRRVALVRRGKGLPPRPPLWLCFLRRRTGRPERRARRCSGRCGSGRSPTAPTTAIAETRS